MTYNPAGGKTYTLGASISSTATSITLSSFTLPVSGTPITMAILDTDIAYGTIGPKTSSAEFISFTGVTQNPNGTATLTGVVRGLDKVSPFTTNATYKLPHSGQTLFILSDAPQVFYEYAAKRSANTFTEVQEFTLLPTSSGGNATNSNQLVTYAQALAMATGTANINRIVVAGNGGEAITAGQLVYLLVTDGEWYKCDADTAATVDNIILGIAQGAGSNGVAITNGVLLFGLDSNQTGLTNNTAYYASNTPGAISSTVGTVEVSVGISRSTTSLLFYPRYNQQLTEDQQDALVGTSGTPSASNKYVTDADTSTAITGTKVIRANSGVYPAGDGSAITGVGTKLQITTTDVTFSNTTTETTILSYSLAGNILSTNNAVKVTLHIPSLVTGQSTGTDDFNFRFKYGGTTLITKQILPTGSVTGTYTGKIEFILAGAGTTSSQNGSQVTNLGPGGYIGNGNLGRYYFADSTQGTSAIDSTTAQNLVITGQYANANAANTITVSMIIVEKIS